MSNLVDDAAKAASDGLLGAWHVMPMPAAPLPPPLPPTLEFTPSPPPTGLLRMLDGVSSADQRGRGLNHDLSYCAPGSGRTCVWVMPIDSCGGNFQDEYKAGSLQPLDSRAHVYTSQSEAEAACVATGCSGLAAREDVLSGYFPFAEHFQPHQQPSPPPPWSACEQCPSRTYYKFMRGGLHGSTYTDHGYYGNDACRALCSGIPLCFMWLIANSGACHTLSWVYSGVGNAWENYVERSCTYGLTGQSYGEVRGDFVEDLTIINRDPCASYSGTVRNTQPSFGISYVKRHLYSISGDGAPAGTADGKLHACQGDCDSDFDCAEGLVCFEGSYFYDVPPPGDSPLHTLAHADPRRRR